MKNLRTILIVIVLILIVWAVKFIFNFPSADIGVIGVILSVSSIIFGLLVGFFISELWSRYTEIRSLQGERSSAGLLLIKLAEHFYKDKRFEKEFKAKMEASAIADEVILWDEGHLEEPYYCQVGDSLELVKIKDNKDGVVFDQMIDSYKDYFNATVKMNILYKERLFFSEWLILIILSLVIFASILFLDTTHILYQVVILVFPAIIFLALSIIYELDRMTWGRELITLEPTQVVLDAIGVKRFYLKKDLKYTRPNIQDFRTEENLKGEAKKVYLDILKKRKMERGR